MGWCVKCRYCGLEEKYRYPSCDCLNRRRKLFLNSLIGWTIKSTIILDDMFGQYLVMNYTKNNSNRYLWISMSDINKEMTIREQIQEIKEMPSKFVNNSYWEIQPFVWIPTLRDLCETFLSIRGRG